MHRGFLHQHGHTRDERLLVQAAVQPAHSSSTKQTSYGDSQNVNRPRRQKAYQVQDNAVLRAVPCTYP